MTYKALVTAVLLFNLSLFSQQGELFKTPPSNFSLPVVVSDADGSVKSTGLGTTEAKWVQASSPDAESLLQAFSTGSDAGIIQMVKNVLMNANISEEKINHVKLTFASSGVEEMDADNNSIMFKEDFPGIYEKMDKVSLITKLFRTKNVKMEVTYEGADNLDKEVSDALSSGLRFGNKTESSIGNKMTIEAPFVIFGYQKSTVNIERVSDTRKTFILGVNTDAGLNSLSNIQVLEGNPNDFFIRIASEQLQEPLQLNVSSEKRSASFRIGNREAYSVTFFEKSGNKVTLSFTGFVIKFE